MLPVGVSSSNRTRSIWIRIVTENLYGPVLTVFTEVEIVLSWIVLRAEKPLNSCKTF